MLGAGASTAEHTGQPPASRERLREVVPLIKALLRGEAVAFGTSPSERIDDPDSPGPSVHLAASGPKAVRLAGEVGDGALLFMGISKPIRVLGAALIAEGWDAAKRQNPAFEVTFNTLMSVDDDPVAARERTRRAAHSWLKLRRFDAGFAEVGFRFEVSERTRTCRTTGWRRSASTASSPGRLPTVSPSYGRSQTKGWSGCWSCPPEDQQGHRE